VIPGVGYLITAGVVRLMKVDRQLMRTIQADLALRRAHSPHLSPVVSSATSQPGEIK
jgi:Na+/melibiose symporter-like transporter